MKPALNAAVYRRDVSPCVCTAYRLAAEGLQDAETGVERDLSDCGFSPSVPSAIRADKRASSSAVKGGLAAIDSPLARRLMCSHNASPPPIRSSGGTSQSKSVWRSNLGLSRTNSP